MPYTSDLREKKNLQGLDTTGRIWNNNFIKVLTDSHKAHFKQKFSV